MRKLLRTFPFHVVLSQQAARDMFVQMLPSHTILPMQGGMIAKLPSPSGTISGNFQPKIGESAPYLASHPYRVHPRRAP